MKIRCPITGCQFKGETKDEWIEHMRDEHPHIESIQYGAEPIRIKGGLANGNSNGKDRGSQGESRESKKDNKVRAK